MVGFEEFKVCFACSMLKSIKGYNTKEREAERETDKTVRSTKFFYFLPIAYETFQNAVNGQN